MTSLHSRHICHIVILVRATKHYFVSVKLRTILGSVRLFILGVKHHISNLLAPSITQLANYAFGETPGQMGLEMADLIDKAIDAVKSAQGLYTTVLNFVNISLQPLAVGSSIPAAAPRELLLTLFLDKPQIVSAISEDMEGSLRKYHSEDTFDSAIS